MGVRERQRAVQLYRGQIPSPGRPTVAWRGDRVAFWAAIARGVKTEKQRPKPECRLPVAFRWFRHAGGVNPCLPPMVTGRYLSFTEREDIAIWHAQGAGVRDVARRLGRSPSTVSRELAATPRLAPTGCTTRRRSPSGTPSAVPAGRSFPSSFATSGGATTSRSGCPALCGHPTARLSVPPVRSGRAATSRIAGIVAGWPDGVRNRSPTG